MSNSTASSIIGYSMNICKIDGNSSGITGLADADMIAIVNRANTEFIEVPYEASGSAWDFMRKETGYTLVAATTLTAAMATTDVTATVSSNTDFDSSSGAAVIYTDGNPDIIEYSGKTSTTSLTGVTGIGFAHASGDSILKLYSLPSTFGRMRSQENFGDGVRVSGVNYFYTPLDPYGARFAFYDNGTTKWIWFPQNATGSASVIYDAIPTTISATTSTVDVPVKYEDFLIYRCVEHIRRVLLYDLPLVQEARMVADKIILDAMKKRHLGKRPRLIRQNPPIRAYIDGKVFYYA